MGKVANKRVEGPSLQEQARILYYTNGDTSAKGILLNHLRKNSPEFFGKSLARKRNKS